MRRSSWLIGLALLGCGSSSTAEMDAGSEPATDAGSDVRMDAEPGDAEVSPPDGGDPESDAAPPDAGNLDAGMPGLDGGPPDAGPPPEACSDEGATRVAECGNCGTGQETCTEGVWVLTACLGEGECAPGAIDIEPLPLCGERARICNDSCEWLDWETTRESDGICEPGERRFDDGTCAVGASQPQRCSDSCEWTDDGPCVADCPDPRTGPNPDQEEVCIPGGEYIRGHGGETGVSPPFMTVYESPLYMDRYPVTRRRYLECVDAGVCRQFRSYRGYAPEDPAYATDLVRGVTWNDARIFCEWDGGRRLPTESEWQKAVRGPAPRMNRYPWGDLGSGACDHYPCTSHDLHRPYGFYGYESYYGLLDFCANHTEWVHDWHSYDYPLDPSTTRDPAGPASGTERVVKGTSTPGCAIGQRLGVPPSRYPGDRPPTFRCVRDPELP